MQFGRIEGNRYYPAEEPLFTARPRPEALHPDLEIVLVRNDGRVRPRPTNVALRDNGRLFCFWAYCDVIRDENKQQLFNFFDGKKIGTGNVFSGIKLLDSFSRHVSTQKWSFKTDPITSEEEYQRTLLIILEYFCGTRVWLKGEVRHFHIAETEAFEPKYLEVLQND